MATNGRAGVEVHADVLIRVISTTGVTGDCDAEEEEDRDPLFVTRRLDILWAVAHNSWVFNILSRRYDHCTSCGTRI